MPGSKEVFGKYPNFLFVETGSQIGEGIKQALEAGFEQIYSIEANPDLYEYCMKRFENNLNVHLMNFDSSEGLRRLLTFINFPCTFWLDAHNEDDYPLLNELAAISEHKIKTHTILIDDLRMLDPVKHGLSIEILTEVIWKINPNYDFFLENGHVKNDILVAKV